jgi:hypothetical protein
MSGYPSNFLTSPQYYHLGWTPKDEVAIVKNLAPGTPMTFTLKKLNNVTDKALSTIIFASKNPRAAFISWPPICDGCIAIHLSTGGSSQLVKRFGQEYYDKRFTGLSIKNLGLDATKKFMTISVELLEIDENSMDGIDEEDPDTTDRMDVYDGSEDEVYEEDVEDLEEYEDEGSSEDLQEEPPVLPKAPECPGPTAPKESEESEEEESEDTEYEDDPDDPTGPKKKKPKKPKNKKKKNPKKKSPKKKN